MKRVTGSTRLAKSINRALILQSFHRHGTISRTDLSADTGLTSGTISNITSDLLAEGLIKTSGTVDSTGGRPQILLEINAGARLAIGTNIGSTNVISVLTRLDGTVIRRKDYTMDPAWPLEKQVDQIIRSIEKVIPPEKNKRQRIIGVGLGVPGLIQSRAGLSVFSPNLKWRNVPIQSILEKRLGLSVTIDNSVRVGALGEQWWGAGAQVSDLVALYVGTGVGAGLILDGRLYKGYNEASGEIGHVVVAPDGQLCSCGQRGCLEAMASGPAIARRALQQLKAGEPTVLRGFKETITGKTVYQAAKQGDQLSITVLLEAARYIGIGISILINLFNPEIVVVNGGVSNSWDITSKTIINTARSLVFDGSNPSVRIVPSTLGKGVGPIGAATLIIKQFFAGPNVK
ncbi:MAG: ROK family protein [Limnochordia bacterium]